MQEVGPVVDATPAQRPARISLPGRYVRLEPLDAQRDGDELFLHSSGDQHAHLWAYLFDGPYHDRSEFDAALERRQRSEDPLFYSILDRESGAALGWAALMRIEPEHRVIEVGHILYLPQLQRTPGATEAMYLLARYVFDTLGYRRYEWKCNSLNAPSRRAAQRYGFTFEGIFRQHLIAKGRNRDTAWYSMLDGEWPARRRAFEQWLSPANFDSAGKQKLRLEECR
jgi:RimJ/RimL family protein N-acetyltransferase